MAKPIVITKDNYKSFITKAEKADKSLRGLVQRLVMFGIEHYNEHHNSNPLTHIMNAKLPSIRTEAVKVYIEDYTDLKFEKSSGSDTPVFKRHEVEGFAYVEPTDTWWEHSGIGLAKAFDPDAKLEVFVNQLVRITKGEGKQKLEEGKQAEAEHMLAYLKQFQPLESGAGAGN